MLRRNRPPAAPAPAATDPLLDAELPARAAVARERLEHQHDPALTQARSLRELAADRHVAETVRDHERSEKVAEVEAAASIGAQVRRTTDEIVKADARDLLLARRAIQDQRRESSPHAQLADLYRVKRWSGRGFAGVVVAAMLWSAVNVQHNVAPGGPGDPLYWASYLLEALVSTVLVIFMMSGAIVARWGIEEGATLIRWTEVFLLAATITLNTFPYLRSEKWFDVAVHAVAPVMIGVALVGHDAVSRRLGAAISRASKLVPDNDDITERLAALTRVAGPTPVEVPEPDAGRAVDEAFAEMASDLARDFPDRAPRADHSIWDVAPVAREPIATRAERDDNDEPIARDDNDRAPRARIVAPTARGSEVDSMPPVTARAAVDAPLEADADRAPIAAHSPADLATDCDPIAEHEEESTRETTPVEPVPRDRRAVVTLVRDEESARAALGIGDQSVRGGRSPRAREASVDGALARSADRAPIAKNAARGDTGVRDIARAISRTEATTLARAVVERRLSKQPVDVLARIYESAARQQSPTSIGVEIGLPHSTVIRAIDAAGKVSGPRAL